VIAVGFERVNETAHLVCEPLRVVVPQRDAKKRGYYRKVLHVDSIWPVSDIRWL
jgi:hypothetical protein